MLVLHVIFVETDNYGSYWTTTVLGAIFQKTICLCIPIPALASYKYSTIYIPNVRTSSYNSRVNVCFLFLSN